MRQPSHPDQPPAPGPMPAGPAPETELAEAPGFSQPPQYPGPASPDPPAGIPAPGSTGDSTPGKAPTPASIPKGKAAAYRKIAEGGFKALGGLLNRAVAGDGEDESFLPDEDDLSTVAPPLGRLAARKVPLGKAEDHLTDIEDLGMAAVGLIAWGIKGLVSWLDARRARTRLVKAAGTIIQPADANPGAQA